MNKSAIPDRCCRTGRVIGDRTGGSGPTIVFIGGMHGNEPAGVIALKRVFEQLSVGEKQIRGRVLGLAGNLSALVANRRFLLTDLNRIWGAGFLQQVRNSHARMDSEGPNRRVAEFQEQLELFEHIAPLLEQKEPVIFIDLHTTSSRSAPFIAINDQLNNRKFAFHFPVSTVLGLEEYLDGPLLGFLNEFGNVALAFEAGQHDDPESVRIHTSFIYLAMLAAGVIREETIDNIAGHRSRLVHGGEAGKGIFETIFRKAVGPTDNFRMKPGYRNFVSVGKGDVLAEDRAGPVVAPRAGRIFMPRYQESGNDGFFIVRKVPMWALRMSSVLRRLNFERVLTLLPGITRPKHAPDTLVVNRKIAVFLATELFHLLGYRRKQVDGDNMIFSRREINNHQPSDSNSNSPLDERHVP